MVTPGLFFKVTGRISMNGDSPILSQLPYHWCLSPPDPLVTVLNLRRQLYIEVGTGIYESGFRGVQIRYTNLIPQHIQGI